MQFEEGAEGTIRVLVAANTRMHSQLLADALRRDRLLEVVGSASHSRDLIGAATSQKIDVVVIGSNLDEEPLRGIEVLRELRLVRPEIRAVILLDSSKREVVLEAFRAGARGLFSRHESLETLGTCVRRVHEGQIWGNSQQIVFAVEALASSLTVRAVSANGLNLLSKREMDVVRCLAEGLTNREIAERLGLSQHTIKNYLFRVFDKLGVSSRLELMSLTLTQPHLGGARGAGETLGSTFESCQTEAENGVLAAQMALAEMYAKGEGVAKDLVSAYMWYTISEKATLAAGDEIGAFKKRLEHALSQEEILEARKRAMPHLKKPRLSSSRDIGVGAAGGSHR